MSTAFCWCHRFLALPKNTKADKLLRIAEADEMLFLRSHKGQHHGLKRGASDEQVPVLMVRDCAGAITDFVLKAADKSSLWPV